MKLIDLISLKEIDFGNQKAFDSYNQKHKLRPDTKVTIAGKTTTAGKAAQKSAPAKGTSVFGKDKGGDVFGKKSDDNGHGSVIDPNTFKKIDKKIDDIDNELEKITDDLSSQIRTLKKQGAPKGEISKAYTAAAEKIKPFQLAKDKLRKEREEKEPSNLAIGTKTQKTAEKWFKENGIDTRYNNDIKGDMPQLDFDASQIPKNKMKEFAQLAKYIKKKEGIFGYGNDFDSVVYINHHQEKNQK